MSVILSFEICQSSTCGSLIFKETTGAFNANTNPNGWGAPNEDTTDALTAELAIQLADGSTYTIDLKATTFFPTTDTTFEYLINGSDIGYDGQIDDQIISFTYTVTTSTETYTQTVVQGFYCQAECCVNKMFVDLDFECDCIKDEMDSALKAFAILQGLKYSANCGNATNFNNLLAQLNKLCAGSSCASCKQQ